MSFAKLVPTEERDYHAGLPAPFPHDLCENLSSGNPAEPFLLDYHTTIPLAYCQRRRPGSSTM